MNPAAMEAWMRLMGRQPPVREESMPVSQPMQAMGARPEPPQNQLAALQELMGTSKGIGRIPDMHSAQMMREQVAGAGKDFSASGIKPVSMMADAPYPDVADSKPVGSHLIRKSPGAFLTERAKPRADLLPAPSESKGGPGDAIVAKLKQLGVSEAEIAKLMR